MLELIDHSRLKKSELGTYVVREFIATSFTKKALGIDEIRYYVVREFIVTSFTKKLKYTTDKIRYVVREFNVTSFTKKTFRQIDKIPSSFWRIRSFSFLIKVL